MTGERDILLPACSSMCALLVGLMVLGVSEVLIACTRIDRMLVQSLQLIDSCMHLSIINVLPCSSGDYHSPSCYYNMKPIKSSATVIS